MRLPWAGMSSAFSADKMKLREAKPLSLLPGAAVPHPDSPLMAGFAQK